MILKNRIKSTFTLRLFIQFGDSSYVYKCYNCNKIIKTFEQIFICKYCLKP